MTNPRGDLSIVLHTHMPYVEGFGTWPFGEEWLWEAVAMSYLRLLPVLAGNPVTVGLTPVLCDQFESLLADDVHCRLAGFLRNVRTEVFEQESAAFAQSGDAAVVAELARAGAEYPAAADRFDALGGDLIAAFRELADDSPSELWTGAATHAVLPMLATDFGFDLQVKTGIAAQRRRFGGWTGGFWLPECAWSNWLADRLAATGVKRFCVDQTAAWGLGALEHLEPVAVHGMTALPIDWQTVALVWEQGGFPAGAPYRDTHRRTTLDAMPWRNDGAVYDEGAARVQARADADQFLTHVGDRLDLFRADRGRSGLCVCALDTELLGHWWYEGPWWLEAVLERASEAGVNLVTSAEAAERHRAVERDLAVSSWGTDKNYSTWDSPKVAGVTWAQRAAELKLRSACCGDQLAGADGRRRRDRAARELLALQSSDWAFMCSRELAGEYPRQRVNGHASSFSAALATDAGDVAVDPRLRSLSPDLIVR